MQPTNQKFLPTKEACGLSYYWKKTSEALFFDFERRIEAWLKGETMGLKIYEPIKKFEFSATPEEIREARRKKEKLMANTPENRFRRIIERGKKRDLMKIEREKEYKRDRIIALEKRHVHKIY